MEALPVIEYHDILGDGITGFGLMRASLSAMRPILLGHTLDLDSTVFCRYGEQGDSLKRNNPIKHGRSLIIRSSPG